MFFLSAASRISPNGSKRLLASCKVIKKAMKIVLVNLFKTSGWGERKASTSLFASQLKKLNSLAIVGDFLLLIALRSILRFEGKFTFSIQLTFLCNQNERLIYSPSPAVRVFRAGLHLISIRRKLSRSTQEILEFEIIEMENWKLLAAYSNPIRSLLNNNRNELAKYIPEALQSGNGRYKMRIALVGS